jgi:hypothetical protein
VSQEKVEESPPRSRIFVEFGQLSSKQRTAVLGLLKDIGYTPAEIKELVVRLPDEPAGGKESDQRRGKRK